MSPEVQTLMSGFRVQGLGFRSLRVRCSTHFTIYFIVIIGNITYSLGFLMALTANSPPQLCQEALFRPHNVFFIFAVLSAKRISNHELHPPIAFLGRAFCFESMNLC